MLSQLSIGKFCAPFIIAEMSGNHCQSLDRALALVDAAAEAGADAVKFQTFSASRLVAPGALKADYQSFGTNSDLTRFDLGLGLDF